MTLGGMAPPPPEITALDKSPNANAFLLTFAADPEAYFAILTSTNLINWTAVDWRGGTLLSPRREFTWTGSPIAGVHAVL